LFTKILFSRNTKKCC